MVNAVRKESKLLMPLNGVVEVSGMKYILVEQGDPTTVTHFKILEDAMAEFSKAKTNKAIKRVWLAAILKEVIP
jgi:hypothetical protein